MQPKTKAVTATILGTVLAAGSAFAQNTEAGTGGANVGAGAQAGTERQGTGAQVGTERQGTGAQAGAQVGSRRGGGVTTGAVQCPEGCVPARPPLSRAERERRRQRAERARMERERERAELSERVRAREQELEQCQTELNETRQNLAQLQDRYQRDIEEQRRVAEAARSDLERERAMATRPVPRGGGPMEMAVRERYRPRFYLGLEGGVSGYSFELADPVKAGGSWGARLGVSFFDWLQVEGRYFGAYNPTDSQTFGSFTSLVTNGGSGVVRFTLPLMMVRPYVYGGFGGYHVFVRNPNNANTSLVTHSEPVAPVGGGVDFMIGNHFSVGGEFGYHVFLRRDRFSTNPAVDNGDIWTTNAVVRLIL